MHQGHRGSCLCKAVTFEIRGEMNPPDACHCSNCRKHTGHFFAFTDVYRWDLKVDGAHNIKWYRSSAKVQRGFCNICGSTLFWAPIYQNWVCVAIGAFDFPPGAKPKLGKHLFQSENGEYYDDDYANQAPKDNKPVIKEKDGFGFNHDLDFAL